MYTSSRMDMEMAKEEMICVVCGNNPADYDPYICQFCASGMGIISDETARGLYQLAFLLHNRASAIHEQLAHEVRVQAERDERAKGLAVLVSPTISYRSTRKLLYLSRLMELVRDVPGVIVECGVGRGESLFYLLALCGDSQRHRHVWGFDSFQGFPKPTPEDASPRGTQEEDFWGDYAGFDAVKIFTDALALYGIDPTLVQSNLTVVKGWFEKSLNTFPKDVKIALLHLDCDLYQSYKTCLERLYDRVEVGGIIAVDEYRGSLERIMFPGAERAINEFMELQNVTPFRDEYYGKYHWRRER